MPNQGPNVLALADPEDGIGGVEVEDVDLQGVIARQDDGALVHNFQILTDYGVVVQADVTPGSRITPGIGSIDAVGARFGSQQRARPHLNGPLYRGIIGGHERLAGPSS